MPPETPSPRLLADAVERSWLRRVVFLSFLLRVVLAVTFDLTGYSRLLAPDEGTYASNGLGLAQYWQGGVFFAPDRMSRAEPQGYFYINAVFFYVFGNTEIPLRIANCFLGAFAARYLYLIASTLFGKAVARRTTVLFLFLPSLLLWSCLNIRDVWVITLILYVSWNALAVLRGYSLLGLLKLVLAVLAITQFREYLFLLVAVPPVAALALGRRGHLVRNFVLACVGGLILLTVSRTGDLDERSKPHMSLESLSEMRRNLASGGSAFEGQADISTPGKALAFLPVGIAYFLFSPFPWQITSVLKLLSLPEMLLFYALTPSVVRGLRYIVREKLRECMQVLLLTALLTVSYALGEGNVGTLYRHRAQAIGFYLMFAAVGLELKGKPPAPARPAAA